MTMMTKFEGVCLYHTSKMPKVKCPAEGCHMKIRLVDVACKCEKTYCPKHRHPEEHACTFDYRASAKEVLLKYMSTPVVASKIEAI